MEPKSSHTCASPAGSPPLSPRPSADRSTEGVEHSRSCPLDKGNSCNSSDCEVPLPPGVHAGETTLVLVGVGVGVGACTDFVNSFVIEMALCLQDTGKWSTSVYYVRWGAGIVGDSGVRGLRDDCGCVV